METVYTNDEGRYGFLPQAGDYFLRVNNKNYTIKQTQGKANEKNLFIDYAIIYFYFYS